MMKNPEVAKVMARAQRNPRVMKAMQECMSNPSAMSKYANDPEIKELIDVIKPYM